MKIATVMRCKDEVEIDYPVYRELLQRKPHLVLLLDTLTQGNEITAVLTWSYWITTLSNSRLNRRETIHDNLLDECFAVWETSESSFFFMATPD